MYQARLIARATDYKSEFVVKAQVQTNNRSNGVFLENGFQSGIHVVRTPEEVGYVADQMCGKTFVTDACPQPSAMYSTGKQGFLARAVYVMEKVNWKGEFFISISLDRNRACPVIRYG